MGGDVAIEGLPKNTSVMRAKTVVGMHPPRAPASEEVGGGDMESDASEQVDKSGSKGKGKGKGNGKGAGKGKMGTNARTKQPNGQSDIISMRVADRFHPLFAGAGNGSSASEPVITPTGMPPPSTEAVRVRRAVLAREREMSGREPEPGDDVVVVPLGTCSAVASKYRNGVSPSPTPSLRFAC